MNTSPLTGFHPGWMVLAGVAVLVLLFLIFWPNKGLLALLSRMKLNHQRILLEDALKYLFDCEYRNVGCDMHRIAGNLNISGDLAGHIVERLLAMGLIAMNNQAISLTDTGRSYSLRVIRVHRVWERYLADETSMNQLEWHPEADRLEHLVTREETEKIAAQIGNPVFDPHGDPIPSAGGEIPDLKGKPLSSLKEGEIGRITHIEDEPQSIYEQLIVQGLYPGMRIYVTDVSEGRITFVADGEECVLTPLFAAQITVEILAGNIPEPGKYELLSSLEIGESAEIHSISANCRGQQRRRLMDLGIVPGSLVSAEMKSASGDPVGYRIMGATIGIRKNQADLILIHHRNGDRTE